MLHMAIDLLANWEI